MHIDKDLVAASATPLVLGILAEGESYGYAIAKSVSELSGGQLTWADGMLYPLLHRLERQGLIRASWAIAENGRRRKHYAITEDGLAALAERRRQWEVVTAALSRLRIDDLPGGQWVAGSRFPTGLLGGPSLGGAPA